MASSTCTASDTVRHIGPTVSCNGVMGTTPARLVNPNVGLMPTTELNDDGQSMEPSVSVPSVTAAMFAATATPAPLAHLGFRAEQRDYDQPVVPAIGGRYLRANGKHTSKYLRWNNGVTVDDVDNVSTMMHWTVEPIPLRGPDMPQPGFAAPIPSRIPRDLSVMLGRERGVWRLIRFVRASAEGEYAEDGNGWTEFQFRGRYVYHLRNELAKRINAEVHLFELAMCVRAGRYGRLIPLVVNLPHGRNGETLQIVLCLSRTPAYDELRHPDVYSQ